MKTLNIIQICKIHKDFINNISKKEICKKFNITLKELNRLIKNLLINNKETKCQN